MPLFQSTHPLRGATSLSEYVPTPSIFQSTHPLRGATASMRSTSISPINFNPRTPCGVRLMNERVNITLEGFQSTHPLRGATDSKRLFLRGYEISIHAPLAGCDVRGRRDRRGLFHISIHAPLAGCDSPHGAFQNKVVNFNPRTPCGVRQRQELRSVEATEISIHAPLAGCDFSLITRALQSLNFNPRTPCGVRQCKVFFVEDSKLFQSTHPLRGATAKLPKYSRQICAKATKFLQSRTKSGVAACWAKGKRLLFPTLRGANLPGKTGMLPVRIR